MGRQEQVTGMPALRLGYAAKILIAGRAGASPTQPNLFVKECSTCYNLQSHFW